jgi:hypothetical protein
MGGGTKALAIQWMCIYGRIF